MSDVIVACCQLDLAVGEVRRNRAAARAGIEAAAARGAQVIVLPELTPSGYVFRDFDEARALSEPLDGPTVAEWTELARRHEAVIVGGICELDGEGVLRNSAVLVDRDGARAVYRKAHLWNAEKEFFQPGDGRPPVVETDFGRIAVMICYDLEFPEWIRLAALAGAQLLASPTNWPREVRPPQERPVEVIRVQANSAVNRIYCAAADRTGTERGVEWVAASVIVGPDGYPLAGPLDGSGPGVIVARCDLARARDKRTSARNDAFSDRRPQLYEVEPSRA
ncbi:MAG: carbon-nitrogen hydrolase [Candidatus Dormibacteraeota bacterium]|nr:carbon-nitrogen hydrolase [Candidatus Dormibacteraeota bacterium]